jgi:hypothetical protein
VFQSFEQYLARAIEHYAAYERGGALAGWSRSTNYTATDKATI